MEDRRRAAKLQEELHRKFSNSDSTHGEVHTEKTQRNVHTGKAHKGGAQKGGHTRRRAHTEYTQPRVHTEKSTHERVYTRGEHTEEYTRGERTRRSTHGGSTHGESTHGGDGGVHKKEFIERRAHFVFALLRMALPYMLSPCVLSFISPSSIELQLAKFSDGIFYALSLYNST